jgi:predicted transcriptional regulator
MEAGTAPSPQTTSVTVNLTPQEQEALNQLAVLRGRSPELVLREGLLEKKFLADHRRAGRQVVLRDADGKLTPINWNYDY